MSPNTDRIDRILQAFATPTDHYCRAELDEALTLREEITPRLLSVVDELAADPEAFAERPGHLHAYAVSLLAHFEEPRAHLPILRAFSLPEELGEAIWGDLTTERLPAMLLKTCGGKTDAMRAAILDKGLNVYVRGAAMDALVLATLDGLATREETLAFFGGLFTGTEADCASPFWSFLAGCATDLWPKEILPALEQAVAAGLIDPIFINLAYIEKSFASPLEEHLTESRTALGKHVPSDVHGYFSWFECFEQKELSMEVRAAAIAREANAREKAKKKQAKRSKKKNRR